MQSDVVVIGAGPAGIISAILLRRAGLNVCLVEKDLFPRQKVCGGCLTPRALELLEQVGVLDVVAGDLVSIDGVSIFSSRALARFAMRGGASCLRSRFDDSLAQYASGQGVEFLDGMACKIREVQADSVVLSAKNIRDKTHKTINTRIVVNAAGLSAARTPSPSSYFGVGALIEGSLPDNDVHMVLGSHGYAGMVTVCGSQINVAAAISPAFVRESGSVASAVQAFLDPRWAPQILDPATQWRGTPFLTRGGAVASARVFSVGDACGYVEPFTGEGMTWALEGAIRLAPIVEKACKHYEPALSAQWEREHRDTIGRHHAFCRIIAASLRLPSALRDCAVRAFGSPLLRPVVGAARPEGGLSWL